jgi:tetratricopeptide (TPR) repeat protein
MSGDGTNRPGASREGAKASVAQWLKAGEQLQRQGRIADAQAIYRKILEAVPREPVAMHYLALTLKKSDPWQAEELMRRSLEIEPREPSFHNNLGNLLRDKNRMPEAELLYRHAIKLKPDYAEAHYNLGLALKSQSKLLEALDALKEAVRCRPEYAEAYTQIGAILKDDKKHEGAATVLKLAVEINPKLFDAQYYLGTTLSALRRYDDAAAALNQAVTLRPDSHEAFAALGNVLQHAGRHDESLAAYSKAVEAKPDYLPAHYDFNSLAWTLGRRDLCFKSYAYARQRLPKSPELFLGEAEIRIKMGQYDTAERLLRQAYEIAPERSDIVDALARSTSNQKKFDESYRYFEEAIGQNPQSVRYRQGYAAALLTGGQPKEALRVLEEARLLKPFNQLTLGGMTLAYRELGDSRYDALVDVEKFVRVYEVPLPAGFNDIKSFNRSLAPVLESLHTRTTEPFDQTLRGGTQTFGYLFQREEKVIQLVRDSIEACVRQYIAELDDSAEHPLLMRKTNDFTFSGSWSCRLKSSGFHTNHVHPMGWISSAYYVDVPDVVDGEAEKQGWLKFGESNMSLGDLDRPARHVKPSVGRLALFPSYFWHGTVPFTSSHNRLTIAFDVVPGIQPIKDTDRAY